MLITLCGSARFEPWFHAWSEALGLSGHMVLGLASYPSLKNGEKSWYTPEQKLRLDALHKEKIMASDAVLFLNVYGYIGESTLAEYAFASNEHDNTLRAKPLKLYALESWDAGRGIHRGSHKPRVCEEKEKLGIPDDYNSPINTSWLRQPWDLLMPAGAERSAVIARLRALKNGTVA